jgi:hypothetical protein
MRKNWISGLTDGEFFVFFWTPMTNQQDVLKILTQVRLQQDAKHGAIGMRRHSLPEWALIARRQLDQGIETFSHGEPPVRRGQPDKRPLQAIIADRLAQAGAVCIAGLEQHGEDLARDFKLSRSDDPAYRGPLMESEFLLAEAKTLFRGMWADASVAPNYSLENWEKFRATLGRLGVDIS